MPRGQRRAWKEYNVKRLLIPICAVLMAAPPGGPFSEWQGDVEVRPAAPGTARHTIHSYFNTNPESPDGKWLLFYSSQTRDGHQGEVRIRERASGKEIVIARNVTTEDAHRAACQQWVSGGRRIVYHDFRDDKPMVIAYDLATRKETILARDRLVSWGQPHGDIVPVYGPHWNPGKHRDLELLNVATGEIRTAVTAAATQAKYGKQIAERFGDKPISIFFPILSPDGQRVVFKLATATGADFRSKQASDRETLIGYDLKHSRFLFFRARWGHPAWHPDSRMQINVPNLMLDTNDGTERPIAGLPKFPGSHPSLSPDGRLFATDTTLETFGGSKTDWGVVVADLAGTNYRILHRFDNSRGATSWRVSHPHPVFSADGRRIYFNVSEGEWTTLHVAEIGKSSRSSE
jgi:Tol biopolymer transport system component